MLIIRIGICPRREPAEAQQTNPCFGVQATPMRRGLPQRYENGITIVVLFLQKPSRAKGGSPSTDIINRWQDNIRPAQPAGQAA
jgi:hypothetical protein